VPATQTPQAPLLQALLLADAVYTDGDTGKQVIAGVFNTISAHEEMRAFRQKTCAFVSLTDVRGKTDITLRYVDLTTNQVLMSFGPVFIECEDPLDTVDLPIRVPLLPIPHSWPFAL